MFINVFKKCIDNHIFSENIGSINPLNVIQPRECFFYYEQVKKIL